MHYAINILHYAWVNSLIILVEFSHKKWHQTRHYVHFCFMHPYESIHYALCSVHLMYNMQLVYCIMYLHYAWVNLFIILVDFSHQKWYPTMDNVHLFCYACIVHYVACMMQYAISSCIMYECILFNEMLNALSKISFALQMTPHKIII